MSAKSCAMCSFVAADGDLRPHLLDQHPGFLQPTKEERLAAQAAALASAAAAKKSEGATRKALFIEVQRTCPLPVVEAMRPLAGGLQLFPDEFFVSVGKDWGWSSQKLTLTTQRVIYSRGRLAKDQESVYLTDVRDVKFQKPMLGFGTLALETAGGHSIEGLPAASNGQAIRDRLMQLIHFARQRAAASSSQATVVAAAPDRFDQLKKLAELMQSGVLTEEEFQTEKKKLLG